MRWWLLSALHVEPKTRSLKSLLLHTLCLKVLVAQSCLTLCNPMDCSPPGSCVCGILQARILEWVTFLLQEDLSPRSSALQTDSLLSEPPRCCIYRRICHSHLWVVVGKLTIFSFTVSRGISSFLRGITNFSNSLNKYNNIQFHVLKIVFVGITNHSFVLGLKLTCFSPSRADIGLSFDDL